MLQFQCDYTEGCHPRILEALQHTNMEQTPGYGMDSYCARARERILAECGLLEGDVHFLVCGTQTNTIVIKSILRPHQGVIATEAGHIATHETGSIEATGHKVLTLPTEDGTLCAQRVEALCREHFESPIAEHMVQPGMVYISWPTECGTLYSKAQLQALRRVCDTYGLPLYLDGARMGYGLGSPRCDLTLKDIAELCDVFYLGGTKCGALFGEALVIKKESLKKDFRYYIKQHGALLAKGRLLGIQFDTLFSDGLYYKICAKAVSQALSLREAFLAHGIEMWRDSPTNLQFPILTRAQMDRLTEWGYMFEESHPYGDGRFVTRFCISWATTDEALQSLIRDIGRLGV